MLVQPGLRPSNFGDPEQIGVPYGSRARLIMLYVQSEALRTRSREVGLGRSMNQWLIRMGVPVGGKSMSAIKDQAERISRCSFTFDGKGTKAGGIARMTIFDRAIFAEIEDVPGQGSLFPQVAKLSEQFFEQLNAHPVPLDEAAVRAISNNSMALDLYAWLSYRLHALKGVTPVSWTALMGQFGGGFASIRNFRTTFLDNLRLALAVYRDANVEVTERGVDLHPSRPAIARSRDRHELATGAQALSHPPGLSEGKCAPPRADSHGDFYVVDARARGSSRVTSASCPCGCESAATSTYEPSSTDSPKSSRIIAIRA